MIFQIATQLRRNSDKKKNSRDDASIRQNFSSLSVCKWNEIVDSCWWKNDFTFPSTLELNAFKKKFRFLEKNKHNLIVELNSVQVVIVIDHRYNFKINSNFLSWRKKFINRQKYHNKKEKCKIKEEYV